jgi:hypothetical protein
VENQAGPGGGLIEWEAVRPSGSLLTIEPSRWFLGRRTFFDGAFDRRAANLVPRSIDQRVDPRDNSTTHPSIRYFREIRPIVDAIRHFFGGPCDCPIRVM